MIYGLISLMDQNTFGHFKNNKA